ncbi:ATP-binding protein [Roseobacter sp. AzwK-3b]|uniref:ATP-binding protein n=1 Tax=Roseobacter sp. AzwK-3b TaxID=351016 RepID=UPI000A2F5B30|nr:ATP-binding protein [Roseobacter sp. AzwK-3b]
MPIQRTACLVLRADPAMGAAKAAETGSGSASGDSSGSDRGSGDPPARATKGKLTLRFSGATDNIRAALRQARRHLATLPVPEDRLATIELVLAEALNNVAEHAYAGTRPGPVTLNARHDGDRLCIVLRDMGRPLPGLVPPIGAPPDVNRPVDDLPEGGFGWFLIRDLTDHVDYVRHGSENRLTLEFATP